MIRPVQITYIEPVEDVVFNDGMVHRKQNFWLLYEMTEPDGIQESWRSFMTLWDGRIDDFTNAVHPKVDDYVVVDVVPGYSCFVRNGRKVCSRELKIVPVI